MLIIRGSLAFTLLVWLLALSRPIEHCTLADTPEKVNTAKKSLDGVAMFTATVSQEARETEPVSLSLQLKNLGKEILVIDDSAMETFSLKVKEKKNGELLPTTRYFKQLTRKSKRRDRDVIIELPLDKQAGVTLPLERLFDLSLEGEYVISVEATFTVSGVPGKIAVEDLPFTIRYAPFVRITKVK